MKLLALFLATAAAALAQGFAPESVTNYIATINYTSATGGYRTGTFSSFFSATHDFTLNATGVPLTDPTPYTWTKTGPNTGRFVETDGIRTVTVTTTFTSATTATILAQWSDGGTQAGNANFAPIPNPPIAPPAPAGQVPLVNISTRAVLAPGQVLNPGFVVGGTVPRRVLIRAIGPGLAALGVPGVMANPSLTVFSGQTQIGANDDWAASLASIFTSVGAFGLPANSKDAALLLTLNPGAYTAQLRGDGAGDVLLEIYFVD